MRSKAKYHQATATTATTSTICTQNKQVSHGVATTENRCGAGERRPKGKLFREYQRKKEKEEKKTRMMNRTAAEETLDGRKKIAVMVRHTARAR